MAGRAPHLLPSGVALALPQGPTLVVVNSRVLSQVCCSPWVLMPMFPLPCLLLGPGLRAFPGWV
jgi:hypothetical protein